MDDVRSPYDDRCTTPVSTEMPVLPADFLPIISSRQGVKAFAAVCVYVCVCVESQTFVAPKR